MSNPVSLLPDVEKRVSFLTKAVPDTSFVLYFLFVSEKAAFRTIHRFAIESVQYAFVSCISASEGVRAVCKAGFQNNSDYVFEYAKPPKDGMFLFKVTRKTDRFSTLVHFDTRTCPNFIWVEKVFDNGVDITMNDFVKMLGAAINAGSYQYGWKVWLDKFVPTDDTMPTAKKIVNQNGKQSVYIENITGNITINKE